ncbi:thiamine phosphate synthase [Clostridium formicaceticum]|uniref:Thiamine-phosphate synthase n=1 Tax=Clostridium formicaceticum TaxID=1497 RepID=A0AAC9RPM2_9CLOT|nr:thiamine phosphate synthase [Clostridium formicaceticum]AOY77453.1 thiamine-phosphate diphosphorylase [Clostridium formicaceticum]ARE88010.1 Thiamine-phosphate synthase [Clostridium formicaceticum]
MTIDYSLYLITDRYLVGNKNFFDAVAKALKGGVTLLQVREKNVSSREFYAISSKLKEITRQFDVPLIINDRLDIALAVDADGLHIGEDDLPIEIARKLLGNNKILGYSASTVEEARYAEKMGANYLGTGAVFPTDSKKDAGAAIGLDKLREVVESVNIPVVGIGGISPQNIDAVKSAGANGIALISAILSQEDTYKAAKELLTRWKR